MSNTIDEREETREFDDRVFEIRTVVETTVRDTYQVRSNLYETTEGEKWLDIADDEVDTESRIEEVNESHLDTLESHASKLVKYSND